MVEFNELNASLRDNAVGISVEAGTVVEAPNAPTDFSFDFDRSDVQTFERVGDDLLIILVDGQVARINGYYESAFENALIFSDDEEGGAGVSGLLLGAGALAGLGGLAALAGGGDDNGSSAPAAAGSYADNVGSTQSVTSTAAITDDTTPGINIGSALTDTPILYVNGVETAATYNPTTGTLTPNTPLAEGTYDFAYTLTDPAGTESEPSSPLTIEIDTTAPLMPSGTMTYADNVGTIQSTTSTASVTDDTTPGINIGIGLTDTPTLYVDGIMTAATYNSITGTLTPNAPVAEGTYDFSYTLTDPVGNESLPSRPLAIEIDTTAPQMPSAPSSYADNIGSTQSAISTAPITDDTTPGINIGPRLADTPSLYVDGVETPAIYDPTTGRLTPTTPLAEGTYDFSYTLTDTAGNESVESSPLTIEIDTTAPLTPARPMTYMDNIGSSQSPTSTAAITDDTTPGINIGVGLKDTPTLLVNGVETPATYNPITGRLTPNTPLEEGVYDFAYTLTDAAGNESAPSNPFRLEIDTTAPLMPSGAMSYADNVGVTQSSTSTAPVTDDTTPGLNVGIGLTDTPTLYVDGVETAASYDAINGTLTPDVPFAEGTYDLNYTLTDAAGNESTPSSTVTVEVDTTAPQALLVDTITTDRNGEITNFRVESPTDGTAKFFTNSANGGLEAVGTTVVSSVNGEINYALTNAISDLIISVTDQAGNTQSTYTVFDPTADDFEEFAAMAGFESLNISAIDLAHEAVDLILNEADILALSAQTDTVIIHGDSDDSITMIGAQNQGIVQDGAGNSFTEFTLGDATIWIDDHIDPNNVFVV